MYLIKYNITIKHKNDINYLNCKIANQVDIHVYTFLISLYSNYNYLLQCNITFIVCIWQDTVMQYVRGNTSNSLLFVLVLLKITSNNMLNVVTITTHKIIYIYTRSSSNISCHYVMCDIVVMLFYM